MNTTETETSREEEARYAELQQMALQAARSGDSAMLLPMLAAGLPVNLADEKGNSLLMLASYHGQLDLTKALLERGAEPDQRNDRNQTPLAGVAFKGGLEMAKLLVAHGADPRADQGGGRYPVQFAAMFGHLEIVEFLESLGKKADVSTGLRVLARAVSYLRRVVSVLGGTRWSPPAIP